MQLRSGNLKNIRKKLLFTSPVASPFASPSFHTPIAEIGSSSTEKLLFAPVLTTSKRKGEEANTAKMAETVESLEQSFMAAKGKVERIRVALQTANLQHGKFSYNALKLYDETVVAAYNEVNSLITRIYLLEPTKRVEHEKKFIDFEELYEFVRIALADMTQAYDNERAPLKVEVPPAQVQAPRAPPVVPSLLLQQTPLPTFDGRYENWHKFKDRFKDIVDKCVGDSPATKLHYLDKALVGKAQGAIDQQTLNDNNYDGAWRILTKKFDNVRMVVQGHITQLLSMKPMVKGTHVELKALLDVVEKRLESLAFHRLKMEDKLSEAIVVNLVISRLDPDTRRAWEATVEHGMMPVYQTTIEFLREHCYMLERCELSANPVKPRNPVTTQRTVPTATTRAHVATTQQNGCPLCNSQDHLIDECDAFKKMDVNTRYTKAKDFGLCFACLKRGHRTQKCKIDNSLLCKCKKKHHPLMHWNGKSEEPEKASGKKEEGAGDGGSGTNTSTQVVAKCEAPAQSTTMPKQVLLATAVVDVMDAGGVAHRCRALLDSGAMVNFVSERMSDVLCLRRQFVNVPVVGVNGTHTTVKFQIKTTVMSRATNYKFSLDCLVVPRVTGVLPSMKVDAKGWPIPNELQLADPKFYDPCRIDLLIGAGVFFELIQEGKIRMSAELPLLQESLLGWLVSGPVQGNRDFASIQTNQVSSTKRDNKQLIELMKRFWALDEQTGESVDDDCEQHFKATYARDEDGRYIVELPFRTDAGTLGDSRAQAEKRFKALENRLEKHPETKKMYSDFIHEYIELGHARVLGEHEKDSVDAYYLPHHCVLKPDSSSTKLRVVFDASAKTTTNLSLNDVLMEAPTVQSPLFDILLRWRLHKYVFTTDVQRMYRQVKVKDNHTKYQRCVWRDERTQPLMDLELQRVTYGIGPAGFLATRSLVQLAQDERDNFPGASDVVLNSFYVDDALAGADTISEATNLRKDLETMLLKGGFKLRKWCANDPVLLKDVPPEDREIQLCLEDSAGNGVVKTLGLFWDPVGDDFLFRVKPMATTSGVPTKSQVLSEIAKLFDPLGLLGPVVILAKIVMQRLWQKNIDWNDPIPDEENAIWNQLRTNLCQINEMRIPRRVTVDEAETYELHGFSDASTRAYGCCIYLVGVKPNGTVNVKLLCAKSRVAPLKELDRVVADDAPPEMETIPRLELCAACLLAEQVVKVREALKIDIKRVILRSDSKIVLCWIKKLKPGAPVFVKNRVAQIRKLTVGAIWLYVKTKDNPADLVSRGVQPAELMTSVVWWDGASDMHPEEEDGTLEEHNDGVEEIAAVAVTHGGMYDTIQKCSDFRRLQRIFGYVTRFLENCRMKQNSDRRSGCLTNADYRDSLLAMVKIVQHVVYHEEIQDLKRNRPLKGKLKNLNPIFDEDEKILRVGGRIRHSDLPKDQKHPMILPENHHFTEMVIEIVHREQLHVGLNGMLAKIRQQFWPVNAKRMINRVLRRCVKCFRAKPRDVQLFMGDLPSARVTAALPFSRTGVDYAGPFYVKEGRLRAPRKVYVCVFVCMCTKAIHLELVGSLSTDGFIGALHRMVSRRGMVSKMKSDNGTNFVGGDRRLAELGVLLKSQALKNKIEEFCQPRGIVWTFNPPKAPHQGGLWEASVKSMKTHLQRVLNESHLTYEEMCTLLYQIEAILNSCPIVPQSDDPRDYQALSPGHFLVGRELTAVAEPFYDDVKENTLSRYQLIQRRKQAYWRRWSNEYLTTLQRRGKWFKDPTLLREGLLVVLKDDNSPPQTWRLARIVETHPGRDGIVRVVTVQTSNGSTYKRSTKELAVLPIDDEQGRVQEMSSQPAPGGRC